MGHRSPQGFDPQVLMPKGSSESARAWGGAYSASEGRASYEWLRLRRAYIS